jgi:hypothetical protein
MSSRPNLLTAGMGMSRAGTVIVVAPPLEQD